MKKGELYSLMAGLEAVKDLKGIKFAYARAKNKKLIQDELQLFGETLKASEKFSEFEDKRVELCKKYCKKDEKGKPLTKNDSYVGLEDNTEFQQELVNLKEVHKDIVTERQNQVDEYNKMLSEETKLDFHKILLEDVPADITGQQLELIMPIIQGK